MATPSRAARAMVDRLRTGAATSVSVGRGGAAIAVNVGPRHIYVFDGARGRLVAERSSRDEVLCSERPITPDGGRALWLGTARAAGSDPATPAVATVEGLLRSMVTGEVTMRVPIPGIGAGAQCSVSIDGTAAVFVSLTGARIVRVPDGTVVDDVSFAVPAKETDPSERAERVERVLTDETGATFVAVLSTSSGGARVLAWGGEGGRRVRVISGVESDRGIVLSPSGALLAVPTGDGHVAVVSTWTGAEVRRFGGDAAVGFVAGDAALVVASESGQVTRFGLESGEIEESFETVGDAGAGLGPQPLALARWNVSEDGLRIAVCADDGRDHRLALYGLEGSARFDRRQLVETVLGLSFDEADNVVVAGDRRVLTLSRSEGRLLQTTQAAPWLDLDRLFMEAPSTFSRYRVGFAGEDVVVIDPKENRMVLSRRVAGGVRSAALIAGPHLVLVGRDSGVVLLSLDGAAVPIEGAGGEAEPSGPSSPPFVQSEVVGVTPAGGGAWWSISRTGTLCRVIQRAPPRCMTVARMSGDVQLATEPAGRIVVVQTPSTAIVIDVASMTEKVRFRTGVAALVALSPDGERLAVSDGTDVTTFALDGTEMARVLLVPDGAVTVSADGAHGQFGVSGAYVRFSEGMETIDRDEARLEQLVRDWTSAPVPL